MTKKITIEDLAVMVNRGFTEIEKKMATKDDIAQVRTEMATKADLAQLRTEMRDGFFAVNRRIDILHEDISDLPDIREAVQDHDKRLMQIAGGKLKS